MKKCKKCQVENCDRICRTKGYCQRHYYHFWKYGDPLITKRNKKIKQICIICQKEFEIYPSQVKRGQKCCSRTCGAIYCGRSRTVPIENQKWYKNKKGYLVCKRKEGQIRQHRFIVEQSLGRKLTKDEYVHHKNHIKDDNRIENLEIITPSRHSSLHWSEIKQLREENEKLKAILIKNNIIF